MGKAHHLCVKRTRAICLRIASNPNDCLSEHAYNTPYSGSNVETRGAVNETLKTNFNFLRASPHPSAGIARLSQLP